MHVLNYLRLKWLQLLWLVGGTAVNSERVVEVKGFFPYVLIYFECQKNTLSEYILCQAVLFFIWFMK